MADTIQSGLLVVLSGPAGSGKGTVLSRLLEDERYTYSVSATTRAPRPGEQDGVNYHFLSREEFEKRIADGAMLEYTEYCGNYYGTPRKETEEVLASGKNLVLEIEVMGAANVKRHYPEAIAIMLLPPSYAEQEKRLRGRGTETEEKILARLERTKEELGCLDDYDYIVYNKPGSVEACADDIRAILRAELCSRRRNPDAATRYFA